MTLLSIIQNACNEMGIPAPDTVETTTDKRAVTLKALARREQIELARRYDWPSLIVEHTFNSAIGTEAYDLPEDMDKILRDTAYNSAEWYRMRGAMTPAEWRYIVNNNDTLTGPVFRVSSTVSGDARHFRIAPVPTIAEALVYEYKTSYIGIRDIIYQGNPTSTAIPLMELNDDYTRLDEPLLELGLKWRWLKSRGLDYGEEYRTYNEAVDLRYAQDITLPSVPLAPRRMVGVDNSPMTDGYVPDRGYGP